MNNQNLEHLDLDLSNYSLPELYALFDLKSDTVLTPSIMKNALKKTYSMHPDKSKLNAKIFIFYSDAYKTLHHVFTFCNKRDKKPSDEQYTIDDNKMTEEVKNILNNIPGNDPKTKQRNPELFNNWFNEQYDKYATKSSSSSLCHSTGYDEWLKSNDDIYQNTNNTLGVSEEEFERHKRRGQSLVKHNGIQTLASNSQFGASLEDEVDNYSSGVGDAGLMYTDLKQASQECIIHVTQDDYKNIPKYKNVDEYSRERPHDIEPLDNSEQILESTRLYDEKSGVERAFRLAREAETSINNNKRFMGHLQQLNWRPS